MSDPRRLSAEQIIQIEAWLAELPEPDLDDPDNPEWTEEDFARAVAPEQMSDEELAAFPCTREILDARRAGAAAVEGGPTRKAG